MMAKVKELITTYCMDLCLTIRSAIKGDYDVLSTNYTADGIEMMIKQETPAGSMHYEIKIISQPYMDPSREKKEV